MGDNELVLATKRIQRDLQAFNLDPTAQTMYNIELVSEENMFQLKGHIHGPPDTPYHGGIFHLAIRIPKEYPFQPPKVEFITKIWHPNISEYQCLSFYLSLFFSYFIY